MVINLLVINYTVLLCYINMLIIKCWGAGYPTLMVMNYTVLYVRVTSPSTFVHIVPKRVLLWDTSHQHTQPLAKRFKRTLSHHSPRKHHEHIQKHVPKTFKKRANPSRHIIHNRVRIKKTSQKHPRKNLPKPKAFRSNPKENNIDVKHPPICRSFSSKLHLCSFTPG